MAQLTIQNAFNLALEHHRAGRLREAEKLYRQILAQQPQHVDAMYNLGTLAHQVGRNDVAVDLMRRTIALRPDHAAAHYELANALRDQRRLDEAVAAYRRAIALRPDFPGAYNNLGCTLNEAGQLDEAAAVLHQTIALSPNSAVAPVNLGNVLKDQGALDEAIAAYRQAIAFAPDDAEAHSNLVYTMHFHPALDARAIANELCAWNLRHARPLEQFIVPNSNDRSADRRLRVGYVSPDFRNHAEAFFVMPLLREHDHSRFEIHCYASVGQPDAVTERFKGYADVWHDVAGDSDAQLDGRIREDRIDLLVDLTMHMANSRLLVFARKPTPVQVAWLAYPGGTGLPQIDYRLTDAFMDPPGEGDLLYVEKPMRLPDCWCCYDPLCEPLPIGSPPAGQLGYITFGCLNNFCKINGPVLGLWAQVLKAVPDSRLMLLCAEGGHRRRTQDFLGTRGIAAGRMEFVMPCPRPEYLRLYERIDIALDPFPYNGITTTCDALWMGVPVVTFAGERAASRAGLGLLSAAGFGELVGQGPEQFVKLAMELAKDLGKLQSLRSTLRQRIEKSPLMDAPRFARNVEAAYRRMWRNWCAAPCDGHGQQFLI